MKSKKLKKIISMAIVGTVMSTITPTSAYATWVSDSQNHWSWIEDSSNATGWKEIDGTWYNFDSDGNMQTGWIKTLDSKWYYMNDDGSMKTGWLQDTNKKWYYMAKSGELKTGWIKDVDEKWYFSDISGAMQTGVVKVQGNVYVFEASGAMAIGSAVIGGETYKIDTNGAIIGDKLPNVDKVFTNEGVVSANSGIEETKGEAVTNTSSNLSSDNGSSDSDSNSSSSGGSSSSSSSGSSKSSNSTSSSTTNSGTSTNAVVSSTNTSSSTTNTTDNSVSTNSDTSKTTDTTQNSTNTNSSADNNVSESSTATDLKSAVAAVKNAKDEASMEKALTENAEILKLNLTNYNNLKYKNLVLDEMLKKDFSYNSGSNEKSAVYFESATIWLDFVDIVYSEQLKEVDPSEIGGYVSMQGSGTGESRAKEEAVAAVVNAQDETAMNNAITNHGSNLGLDLTDYNGLKDKTAVQKALIGKFFDTMAEEGAINSSTVISNVRSKIKQAFDDAVSAEKLAEENASLPTTTTTTDSAVTVDSGSTNSDTGKTSDTTQSSTDTGSSEESSSNNTDDADSSSDNNASESSTATDLKSAVAAVKNAKDEASMEKALTENAEILKLNLTNYNNLKYKNLVLDEMLKKDFSYNSGSNEKSAVYFESATIWLDFVDIVYSEQLKEVDPSEIGGYVSMQGSGTGESRAIEEAVAAVVNAEDETEMDDAITNHGSNLGLDLTDYNGLKDKTAVQKALIGKFFNTMAEEGAINSSTVISNVKSKIKQAFNDAVSTEELAEENASLPTTTTTTNSSVTVTGGSTNSDTGKTSDTTQSSTDTGSSEESSSNNTDDADSSADNNASESSTATDLKNAVAAVKNAKDTAAMEKAITDNKDILELRLSQYNLLNDKTPVYQALIEEDFSDNTGSNSEVSLFFEKLNIEMAFDNEVYTQYIKETGSSNTSMGGTGTGEVLAKATWIASVVNAEDETEFEKALEEKSGSWGLDLTEYNALKDKDAVRKAVIEKLSSSLEEGLSSTSSTYYIVISLNSQMKQIFDDAVSAEKSVEKI